MPPFHLWHHGHHIRPFDQLPTERESLKGGAGGADGKLQPFSVDMNQKIGQPIAIDIFLRGLSDSLTFNSDLGISQGHG